MTMEEIKGVARARIRPGKLEAYKRLCDEAMEIVRTKDTGTLQYEIFFNDDESEAIVFERYRDIDAAMEHFANISHLMAPLIETAEVTGEVLGKPSPRMQLGNGGPNLYTPWRVFQDLKADSGK
jgi:quinol monooxygenase YgiN